MHRLRMKTAPAPWEPAALRAVAQGAAAKAAPPPSDVFTPEAARRRDEEITELRRHMAVVQEQLDRLNAERLRVGLASIACLGCPKMRDT
jgi:hypothetical protein